MSNSIVLDLPIISSAILRSRDDGRTFKDASGFEQMLCTLYGAHTCIGVLKVIGLEVSTNHPRSLKNAEREFLPSIGSVVHDVTVGHHRSHDLPAMHCRGRELEFAKTTKMSY